MKENKQELITLSSQNLIDLLPYEIICLIFSYTDHETLTQNARTCHEWHYLVLSNSFLKESVDIFIKNINEELGGFLENLKNERERLKKIDTSKIIDTAIETGSTTFILTQLKLLENRIEEKQNKLNDIYEKENENKKSIYMNISIVDPMGGAYCAYGNGQSSDFVDDVKRFFHKKSYKTSIKKSEKEEEKILNNFCNNNRN